MADIFLSYARPDRQLAEQLADALVRHGFSVWWDRRLRAGADFSREIERELANSAAVLVCWSRDALSSRWVKDEADEGARGSKLVAISLDHSIPPLGYRQYHCQDFSDWNGDPNSPVIDELVAALRRTATQVPTGAAGTMDQHPVAAWRPYSRRSLVPASAALLVVAIAAAAWFWFNGTDAVTEPSQAILDRTQPDSPLTQSSADLDPLSADATTNSPPQASIAVLAFADLSPDGDQGYFADGLSEEILNVLARVAGLKVASRTSAFAMRDRPDLDARRIAKELGVRHLLEGSVRKAGDTVRITVQLIDAAQDSHLYSETYDRALSAETLFEVQEDVARTTVTALGDRGLLADANRESIQVATETRSLSAYEAYLEAHEIFVGRQYTRFPEMLSLFERSVNQDPTFARARSALSSAYTIMPGWGYFDRPYAELAQSEARKALNLDPTLSMAYAVLSQYACKPTGHYCLEREALLDKAIAADPKDPALHNFRGQLLMDSGYFSEAKDSFDQCLDIDRARILCKAFLMVNLTRTGDQNQGLKIAQELASNRTAALHIIGVAAMLHTAGRQPDAYNLIASLNAPDFNTALMNELLFSPETADQEAIDMAWQQEKQRMVVELRLDEQLLPTPMIYFYRQFDQLSQFDGFVAWQTFHADFQQSPIRYQLFESVGLPDFWRARGFPDYCKPLPGVATGERDYRCD